MIILILKTFTHNNYLLIYCLICSLTITSDNEVVKKNDTESSERYSMQNYQVKW